MKRHQRLPISRVLNLRDLGGYQTTQGQSLRWGALFRSGSTNSTAAEDIDAIRAAGIRFAFDLRNKAERLSHPSCLAAAPGIEYCFHEHDEVFVKIERVFTTPTATAADAHQAMLESYRSMPLQYRDAYRLLFAQLEQGRVPMLFSCSAGKDRTGVAAALVLSALGIPKQTVFEDYQLSEMCFEDSCRSFIKRGLPGSLDRSVWEPIMRTDQRYLHAMWDELTRMYGSIYGYLERELAIGPMQLARIRSHVLTDD